MNTFSPFMVHLVCGSNLTFENGFLGGYGSSRSIFILSQKIDFQSMIDIAYTKIGVSREFYNLKFSLWYSFNGNVCKSEISDDTGFESIYFLNEHESQYTAQFEVEIVQVIQQSQISFVDHLRTFSQVESDDRLPSSSNYPSTIQLHEDEEHTNEGLDASEEEGSEISNDTLEEYSVDEEVSEDEGGVQVEQHEPIVGFANEQDYVHDRLPFDDDDEQMDFWTQESGDLRKGMFFKTKAELIFAVRRWNIRNNRELFVKESTSKYWSVCCYTVSPNYDGDLQPCPCSWKASGSNRNKFGIWSISVWRNAHNCYGSVVGNNNRCLSSSMIATDIGAQVKLDIAYPIKHVRAHVKSSWNVDVSYDKAWNARRIATERIFGTWESNFAELPKYVDELLRSNPDTIVRWLHHPEASPNGSFIFKYIFWAFGPAIQSFQHCIPVVFVDGTHLKGNYKGKLLTAVTKNANGNILPVAFAMVDEETNDSWSWFLRQFQAYVANHSERSLCVISDRHKGIINAMEELRDWHHRYCLRHVRSNLMQKFKNHNLKKWCWVAGSTTQRRKYIHAVRKIKGIDQEAWKYLKEIGFDKWTQIHDHNHRRWGNLTTNIAESMNNVIRSARMMPIKACIQYTFDKCRAHIVKHFEDASRWTSPLARNMWRLYTIRENTATQHSVEPYDVQTGEYKVSAGFESTDYGGNDYIVVYGKKTCSCGKWQIQRFICSHGLAVDGHVNIHRQGNANPKKLVSKKYTTNTWKTQYTPTLRPLQHFDYWTDATWTIEADTSRVITHRGRRRSRRIRNEMDQPSGPRQTRCGICNGTGHNSRGCTNR